jgi:predicted MFS family arabinose efflux permease
MTTASSPRRTTYRQVLAEPRFRLLLTATTLVMTADSLRIATLSMLVYSTTRSALLSAVTFGIGFLPQMIGSTLLGALADRLPPRRLIASGYAAECASATVLGSVRLPVGAVLVLVAAVACWTPVFGGASNRLIGDTLTGDAYVVGRSLSNMAASGSQLTGLAISAVAVAALGPRHALLVGAAAYATAAVAVRVGLPRLPRPKSPTDDGPRTVLHDSLVGTRQLLGDARVRRVLLMFWLPAGMTAGAESLVVPYAGGRGFPSGSAAWLLACLPVGMLTGDLVVGRFLRPEARERAVVPLIALLGLPLAVFLLDPPYAGCAAVLCASGTGFAYGLGLQRVFLDSLAEPVRGQGFGLLASGLMTLQGVGPLVVGGIAQFTSAGTAIAAAGTATVLTALWQAATHTAIRHPAVEP